MLSYLLKLEAMRMSNLKWKYLIHFSAHGGFRCAGMHITHLDIEIKKVESIMKLRDSLL